MSTTPRHIYGDAMRSGRQAALQGSDRPDCVGQFVALDR